MLKRRRIDVPQLNALFVYIVLRDCSLTLSYLKNEAKKAAMKFSGMEDDEVDKILSTTRMSVPSAVLKVGSSVVYDRVFKEALGVPAGKKLSEARRLPTEMCVSSFYALGGKVASKLDLLVMLYEKYMLADGGVTQEEKDELDGLIGSLMAKHSCVRGDLVYGNFESLLEAVKLRACKSVGLGAILHATRIIERIEAHGHDLDQLKALVDKLSQLFEFYNEYVKDDLGFI